MLRMFLWACKHFYCKHISCKMLEPYSKKVRRPDMLQSQQANSRGAGSRDPTWSELPSAWVGMCDSQANQTSKVRAEEGMFLFFFKRIPNVKYKALWNISRLESKKLKASRCLDPSLLPWPKAVHTSKTKDLDSFPSSSQLPGGCGETN